MSKIRTENTVANFNKKLQKIFDKFGVEKSNDFMYEFALKTPYGTLLIDPRNEPDKGRLWTIFMRFDSDWDKDALVEQLSGFGGGLICLNQYSGKWNIHNSVSDEALKSLEWRLNQLGLEPILA
jgi:hypothetical protein